MQVFKVPVYIIAHKALQLHSECITYPTMGKGHIPHSVNNIIETGQLDEHSNRPHYSTFHLIFMGCIRIYFIVLYFLSQVSYLICT